MVNEIPHDNEEPAPSVEKPKIEIKPIHIGSKETDKREMISEILKEIKKDYVLRKELNTYLTWRDVLKYYTLITGVVVAVLGVLAHVYFDQAMNDKIELEIKKSLPLSIQVEKSNEDKIQYTIAAPKLPQRKVELQDSKAQIQQKQQ